MAGKNTRVLTASALLVGAALGRSALAAGPSPAAGAAPAADPAAAPAGEPDMSPRTNSSCFPACRPGYLCHEGHCVSMCNPPCPEDHVCVDGVRCELPSEAPPAREPTPPPLPPRGLANRTYSAIGFHLGFSGSGEHNGDLDLAPTLGFNIRTDIPVVKYILVGPLVQFGAWRPESLPGVSSPSRNYYVDIDLYVRGRVPIDVDSIGVQVWGGVPIGLSLSFLGNDVGRNLEGFGIGWNVGVMFGGAIHFNNKFGMFTELGWLQHKMSHDHSAGGGSDDLKISQGVFNIGFIFGE